ncbi:S-layer protein [archaeon]|nr:MAG: S-layer protein [archaeon]
MRYRSLILLFIILTSLTTMPPMAAADEPELERDFFIDSETGIPNCKIVVGAKAAVSDVISASWIATQIGSMAYYTVKEASVSETSVTYDSLGTLYNAVDVPDDVPMMPDLGPYDPTSGPSSISVIPYSCTKSPSWNYDAYIDAQTTFSEGQNWLVDTGFSFETLAIDLSFAIPTPDASSPFAPDASQTYLPKDDDERIYPAVFPRSYWGVEIDGTSYDPRGGAVYRVMIYGLADPLDTTTISARSTASHMRDPIYSKNTHELYNETGKVYFLGQEYPALSVGTDGKGYDYMLYGTPHWNSVEAREGTAYVTQTGWTVEFTSINIYDSTVSITATSDEGSSKDIVIGEGESFAFTSEVVPGVSVPVMAISISSLAIRSSKVATCSIYSLSGVGAMRETIYELDDPYTVSSDHEWYLDIMPLNGTQRPDVDNDPELYRTGNPSYNASDSLSVHAPAADKPLCVPYLELWLATPIVANGSGSISVPLFSTEETHYATMEVTDDDTSDAMISGHIRFTRKNIQETTTVQRVDIEPQDLAIKDTEITSDMKSEYNLILIGGPVANKVVQEIIALGLTSFETWATSVGEFQYYADVFVKGKDVIVVAGKDREATHDAARSFLNSLSSLQSSIQ